jgi:hypothetical protein
MQGLSNQRAPAATPTQKADRETVDFEALVKSLQPVLSRVRTDVCWMKGKASKSPVCIKEPLTHEKMLKHVNGGPAFGVAPIMPGSSTTRVSVLDHDSHKGESTWADMQAAALKVIVELEKAGMKPVAFRSSGGRGIHTYVLWDEPQDAYSVRMFMRAVLARVGFEDGTGGVARGQIEVFPKQDAIEEGKFGNMFVLPLAGLSVPLDTFELEDQPKTWSDWRMSPAVPVVRRQLAERPASAAPQDLKLLESALAAIPNEGDQSLEYDDWLKILFALHHDSQGSDDGLALAHAFSSRSVKYNPDEVDLEWGRFKGNTTSENGVITGGTILKMAREHGWVDASVDDFDDLSAGGDEEEAEAAAIRERNRLLTYGGILGYMENHSLVDESTVLGDAVTTMIALAKLKLTAIESDDLVNKLKEITGGELSVSAIRKDVAHKAKARAVETHKPGWLKGWVFVTDMDRFFDIKTARAYTKFSFDTVFGRYMPEDANGNRRKASLAAAEDFAIQIVDNTTYMPMCGPVFEMLGRTWGNLYRPDLVPEVPEVIDAAGMAAVETVKGHLHRFLPDARERCLFTSWLAHNVQKPGTKIRWSPYVCGVEGDGKTFFSQLLSAVLGAPNVKPVNASTIEASEFNEWATGAAVIGIEEVKLQGHNRHDVANRLKPLITNDIVQIHPKGRPAYPAPNVTNYLLFSNHPDGMPVTDTDRRYFFLRGALDTEQASELTRAGYFKALFTAAHDHSGALRKWLIELKLDAEFDADGRAPDTEMKRAVIQMCKNDLDEAFDTLVDWSTPDRPRVAGVGPKVISSAHLTRYLKLELGAVADTLATTRVNKLLSNAGYTQFKHRLKWRGGACRVWLRGASAPSREDEAQKAFVRKLLDETEKEANAAEAAELAAGACESAFNSV